MRTTLPALGFLVFICGPGRANDVAAVTVVENAVRAMANSDLRLNRLSSVIRKESGTLNLPTGPAAVQRTVFLNPPERLKYEAVLDLAGQKQTMILALNGVNGWQKAGLTVKDLTPAEYDVMHDEAYAWWLTTLLPLRQRDAAIKPAPPATIGG